MSAAATSIQVDPTKAPATQLYALARDTVDLVGGDYDEAESRLRYLLRKEREKWFDLMVDYVAEEAIRHARLSTRRPSTPPAPGKDRGLASMKEQVERRYTFYAQWQLSSGVELIRATKKELEESRDFYRAQGRTMMARADWMDSILRKMGRAETVGEAMGGKELAELYEEAESKWTSE